MHPRKYYSATKKNEVLIHATTWMTLENIMPHEKSQTEKLRIVWFDLYQISEIGKSIEREYRVVVVKDRGVTEVMGEYGVPAQHVRDLFWNDRNILELDIGIVCTTL